jgi:hypothetical protein
MENDPVFLRFVERRRALMQRSDTTKAQVDAWIEHHMGEEPSLSELASLEGILAQREALLSEFLEMDRNFMDHLLNHYKLHSQPPKDPS